MKKSELKQIIKEEIKAVFEADVNRDINDKFTAAMGFKKPTGGSGNLMGFTIDKLTANLPETDKEVPVKDMRRINTWAMLPSLPGVDGFIYSKEKGKNWVKEFKRMFNEIPRFKIEKKSLLDKEIPFGIVINSEEFDAWKNKPIIGPDEEVPYTTGT